MRPFLSGLSLAVAGALLLTAGAAEARTANRSNAHGGHTSVNRTYDKETKTLNRDVTHTTANGQTTTRGAQITGNGDGSATVQGSRTGVDGNTINYGGTVSRDTGAAQ